MQIENRCQNILIGRQSIVDKIEKIKEYRVVKYFEKYWGVIYQDGHCTSYDWVDVDKAERTYQHNGKYYLNKPEDLLDRTNTYYLDEIRKGKVVTIRETSVYEEIA